MLQKVTLRVLAIAVCGWLACDAGALTVGRARGAVLIGRPLELAIPVSLDPKEDEPCASADVFYGEDKVRQPPAVRWQPGNGGQGVLRVTSPVPVSEPMITVYLRVGCAQPTTRRFVMLSEVPPESEPSAPLPRSVPAPVQAPVVQSPAAATAPQRATAPAPTERASARPLGPRRRVPTPGDAAVAELRAERAIAVPRTARSSAPAARARKPVAQAGRPRLQLEPIDLGPEREPTLRLSTEMQGTPASDPQRRAEAAALWAVLQKGPDEILRDSVRLQAVQQEIQGLRQTTQQNAAAVAAMRAQVERAHAQRGTAAVLVAALSAVLAALLAWLGWRWYAAARMQRVGRWFEQNGDSTLNPEVVARNVPTVPNPAAQEALVAASTGAAAARAAAAPRPAATPAPTPAIAPARPAPAAAPRQGEEFQPSRGTMRMVGVEELIDVHDKADFFLSIGEVDQAVSVLEAHVHDQVETSALAWMDLLELYHSLGKRAEFERLRSEFRQRFTAQVPDFEHFDQPTATLENYSRALSRIVALWPSRRVLDVIEESIFRKPGLPGSEPFSLEAYRELALLYHVARELQQQEGRDAAPSRFHDTSLQPLNMPERAEAAALSERDRLLIPPASARLGVDIDVGAPAEDEPQRELPPLDFDLDEPTEAPAADALRKRG